MIINGYSQPGASSNTLASGDDAVLQIVVRESLTLDTTNSTVRGLVIEQIRIGATPNSKGSNVVEGCFVGIDATGTNSLSSGGSGLFVQTPGNRIGGTNPGARNIISGKGTTGIEVFELFASNNIIQGNFIGTDRTGTQAIGNTDRAIAINMNASATTIGGPILGAGNVISGNLNRGITLDGSNNVVQGNFIGTDVTGVLPLGNARTGVEIGGSSNNIGGTLSSARNIIAFNGVDGGGIFTTNGIDVKPGTTSFTILGNSIFDNRGLGIDVNANGIVTAGFPVLTLASNTITATLIRGTFTPSVSFLLQLFTNPTADPSGFGEGKTLLVSTNTSTDAGGNFTVNWPTPITPGLFITATANGNTEFSQVRMVTAAGTTNRWTNSVSGKWETGPNWSLNVPPYIGHALVLITNTGTKTVSNDAVTASGFPTTLTISNLTISAPAGSTNTLLLAHGGTNTPLRIRRNLTVQSGGSVVIDNAALSLEGPSGNPTTNNGTITLNDGSLTATNNGQFYIGNNGNGTLNVSNGTFTAYYPIVGIGTAGVGTWNIAGGNNIITTVFDIGDSLTATGTVRMTDGFLTTPALYIGLFGNGSLIVSNGLFNCDGQVLVGSQPGSVGNFTVAGGSANSDTVVVSEGSTAAGTMLVTGTGTAYVSTRLENRTSGTIKVDGGTLAAVNMVLLGTSQFIFNQGMLLTISVGASNNVPFVVGDGIDHGTNSAQYSVFPGSASSNTFTKGLRISPKAALGGYGVISGMVTNLGTIEPFVFVLPAGRLDIYGGLVLSNSSDLRFKIAGYESDAVDFLHVQGNVSLGGKLSVTLTNSFETVVTNGSGFVLMTNSTIFTGAFSNVVSGGLLTTEDGYARFTVLYAGSTMLRVTNLVIADSDGDGIPNWWEDQYGLNKNDPSDGPLDPDEDGASNLNEYLAGTNPNFTPSVFRVVAIQPETNNVRITWNTVGPRSYRVQTNAPSVDGGLTTNYSDLSPLIFVADDDESTTNFLHLGGYNTNLPARYYRVRLVP